MKIYLPFHWISLFGYVKRYAAKPRTIGTPLPPAGVGAASNLPAETHQSVVFYARRATAVAFSLTLAMLVY